MTEISVECRTAGFGYEPGKTVIRVPELKLLPGEISVFCGGNGTGKTTLMKGLAGLLLPGEGTVVYRDGDGKSLSPREMILNALYVHQDPYIFKGTVHQNLALFLPGIGRAAREERIAEALSRTGLLGFEKKSAATLSGGEKKRLALARALAARKRVLLLDEPTANVDSRNTGLLGGTLEEFRREGMTVVIATHDRDFAGSMADVIYYFAEGRLSRQLPGHPEGEENC